MESGEKILAGVLTVCFFKAQVSGRRVHCDRSNKRGKIGREGGRRKVKGKSAGGKRRNDRLAGVLT